MMVSFFAYFFTFAVTFIVCKKAKIRFKEYPKLKLIRKGVKFFSYSRHRIKIHNANFMQVGKVVYLKKGKRQIELKNVDNIYLKNDYLYFTAKGNCEICFCNNILAKYFNVKVTSKLINVEELKQLALKDLINNLFDLKQGQKLNEYLKILRNILKIDISSKCLKIEQNQFKIPFVIEYKLNNKRKVIYIN